MPKRTPRACRSRGCRNTTTDKSGYCEQHLHQNWSNFQKRKGSSKERGYDSTWAHLREQVLTRDKHLCQTCLRRGIVKPGDMVDHKVNKAQGGNNSLSNLETICRECHATKTGREGQKGQLERR